MTSRWLLVSLVAVGAAAPSLASAQQRAPSPDPRIYTEELSPRQIQRAQEPDPTFDRRFPSADRSQTPPARSPTPPRQPTSYPPAQPPAQPARAIACSGGFAKDSSHLKLATLYKSENVVYTEVDASEGKKLMASVLFPKDPKRRLEVWWDNEASRTGTYLIVINGQSTWSGPKGLKLGLALAALERLNGKPFKVNGFKGNEASVGDWQGGALESLTGGCKVGVSLRADPKAPPQAIERAGSAELVSTDTALKAIKPVVAEIIVGY